MFDWTDDQEVAFNEGAAAYGSLNPRNPYTGRLADAWAAGYHMMFMADPADLYDDEAEAA